VDQVFINGKKVGYTGQFPPNYTTAYNAKRHYMLPHKLMYSGKEVTIAVRVYDQGGEGGIIHGNIAIMVDRSSIYPDIDLQGEWKFKTGFCQDMPAKNEYENWNEIYVPGIWEEQGYKDYDGIACYVKEFDLEGKYDDQRMVIMLGFIDDLDMVYINGTLVGQSSDFEVETVHQRSDTYKQFRGYYIPPGVLINSGTNVIVVKVLDYTGLGGIWDGTIGLITQDNYIDYWRKKRNAIQN
jgi:sialate O-acetylesterase